MRSTGAMKCSFGKRLTGSWLLLVYCGVGGCFLLGAGNVARAQEPREPSALAVLSAAEQVLSDVIAKNERSLVSIARVKRGAGGAGGGLSGAGSFGRPRGDDSPVLPPEPGDPSFVPNEYASGVIIDSRGLVLTNYHVLEKDCDYYVTTVDRKTYAAKVKAADHRSDLAVLEVESRDAATKEFTAIKFGNASTLKKGHIVIALGNPYAIARDGQPSATWGIVSNLSRKAALPADKNSNSPARTRLDLYGSLIQTDAKLPLGTSGGALLNLRGEMIGLTTSVAAVAGYEQEARFALPVDEFFLRVIEALKRGKEVEYGFLGIQPGNLSPEQIRAGRKGVVVRAAEVGTPAYRSGLTTGDLITALNGEAVYDADNLVLRIGKLPVESQARLMVERGGRLQNVAVVLGKFPDPAAEFNVFQSEPDWRGLQVDYPVFRGYRGWGMFRRQFDPALIEGCVTVRSVATSSAAWEGGLRPGTLITHVEGVRVQSPREFREAIAGRNGKVTLRVSTTEAGEEPTRVIDAGK